MTEPTADTDASGDGICKMVVRHSEKAGIKKQMSPHRIRLTPSSLGQIAKIGAVVVRWERFHFNPYPTQQEFEALAEVVGVEVERLWEMMPPMGEGMKCEPIRVCGACYAQSPCHRIEWQFKSVWKCDRHQLKLLAKCPQCEARFKIPALWEHGRCDHCRLLFDKMNVYQKII